MSDNLSSLPEPTGAPSFEKFEIVMKYDKDRNILPAGTSVIDLKALGVIGEILYYETIFSPVLTVSITIANANPKVKIFQDYSILGGEFIRFVVQDVMSSGDSIPGILFEGVVNNVDNYGSNNFAEVFRIKATSSWVLSRASSLSGTVTGSPSEIVRQLLKENLEASGGTWKEDYLEKDNATNKVTYNIGQERKDNALAVCMRLASMAQYNKNAGFFFWRTKVGFNFRSIDSLVADGKTGDQKPLGITYTYDYKGFNPGSEMVAGEGGASLTALNFQIQTTDYSVKKQIGVSGDRMFTTFDPIRYDFHKSDQSSSVSEQFSFETLTNANFVEIAPNAFSKLTNFKPEEFLGMTVTDAFNYTLSNNPHKDKAISRSRYASLLDVTAIMTVPLNTSLLAGTCVYVNIPRTVSQQDCSFEENIISSDYNGLYIIAAVCHAMDVKKGYSSLHLVRDYGKFKST